MNHHPERSFAHRITRILPLLVLALIVGQAQVPAAPPPAVLKKTGPFQKQPGGEDKVKVRKSPKHDLQVFTFTGTVQGTNYLLGGVIKNAGPAAYSGGRFVRLYNNITYKGSIPVAHGQMIAVPPLQPGQTWSVPGGWTIPAASVPTNRFLLVLSTSPADANRDNDTKPTAISEVR